MFLSIPDYSAITENPIGEASVGMSTGTPYIGPVVYDETADGYRLTDGDGKNN